ncbi:hypothetical protein [Metabacillus arenae]|uniref:Uncharacterized protein n=1 Tax=Metabacillus arenae TaxID=2771434 RepID=A0A926NHY9_9BACI|nr:hypothetical protein [Metabacillus arenae]MBD1380348.1 hypothetical protein [Metabacillus arenae]
MTKKTEKSKEMQNHKRPMDKELLQEEFGHELGHYNEGKVYETLADHKRKSNDDDCECD